MIYKYRKTISYLQHYAECLLIHFWKKYVGNLYCIALQVIGCLMWFIRFYALFPCFLFCCCFITLFCSYEPWAQFSSASSLLSFLSPFSHCTNCHTQRIFSCRGLFYPFLSFPSYSSSSSSSSEKKVWHNYTAATNQRMAAAVGRQSGGRQAMTRHVTTRHNTQREILLMHSLS